MEFWYVFYIALWILFCLAIHVNERIQKILLYVVLFVIWFIGSFRLNIGTDYSTYELLYDAWDIYRDGSVDMGMMEPGFVFLVAILNYLGLKSQSLFLIIETITLFFLYKGCYYYTKDIRVLLAVIILYAFFPTNGGHWWDMNAIRQAAAISISFYGTGYLCDNKWHKFLATTVLAMLFHYSAMLVVILCFCRKKKIPLRYIYSVLMFGFVFNALGINSYAMMKVIGCMASVIGKYESAIIMADTGTLAFSLMAFGLVIMYYGANKLVFGKTSIIIHNGAAIYIILRVYMAFGIDGSVLSTVVHRFETYFLFFYLLLLATAIRSFVLSQHNRQFARICVMVFIFFFGIVMGMDPIKKTDNDVIAKMGTASSGNIKYEFNFDFIK